MNMDIDIVNRALYASGVMEEKENEGLTLLSESDRDSENVKQKQLYEVCKGMYLSTFLEAVSEVPWTMGRRRKRLLHTTLPHGHSGYRFVYDMPYDCARPVELSDKGTYVIDGNFICTDSCKAELLYVSNGHFILQSENFEPVSVAEFAEGGYEFVASPGTLDDWDVSPDLTLCDTLEDMLNVQNEEVRKYEDYPKYKKIEFEPKFNEYLENMLAARLAVKNTHQPRLHDTLMQKAMLAKQEAIKSTRSITANKQEPSTWWADRLGIGLDF